MKQSKASVYIAVSVLCCLHAPLKLHSNNLDFLWILPEWLSIDRIIACVIYGDLITTKI